jgi:hypothetical protein
LIAEMAKTVIMNLDAISEEHRTKPPMSASAPISERPSWLQDFNSMLVSASFHFTLLIILGLITVAGSSGGGHESIVMTLGGTGGTPGVGNEDTIPDGTQLEDPSQLSTTTDLAAAIGPPNNVDLATPITSEIVVPDALALSATQISGAGGTSAQGAADGLKSELFGVVGGNGPGLGGSGNGGTTRASTDFFGIGGYGQTFVYVVDASDSMNDNGKFVRARYELLRSIEQLGREQKFFVIFYNEGAYPMDSDAPLVASKENIAKATQWINAVEPTGGTNPLPALVFALSLRPDAIYFLSDGQFDPYVIQEMRTRNRQNFKLEIKQVPIHTIAFFDRMAEGLMRTIARNSGGEYKFVK